MYSFLRASCRIRTNDPEITNHVLWPTELKRRVGKLTISLAAIKPWRIRRELAVWDLPVFHSGQTLTHVIRLRVQR